MKLLPIPPALTALLPPAPQAAAASPHEQEAPAALTALTALAEQGWLRAYRRHQLPGEEGGAGTETLAAPLLPPVQPTAPAPAAEQPLAAAGLQPATATAARVDALRRLADPATAAAPWAQAWQVELPAPGPAWQLQVAQVRPGAPLALTLQVPAQAQPLARQQLGELDRRLREAGHELLRPRLGESRAGRRAAPPDEVMP